jgi:uncharacterized protein with NAD-binding domain and iron-sulfur cluster
VGGAGVLASAARATSPLRHAAKALPGSAARIAIVGGGLAGLRCAHELWNGYPSGPIAATVYEANPERAGGRCWTLRDFFADGLITEHGGAFIDSNHRAVRRLAANLAGEHRDRGEQPPGQAAARQHRHRERRRPRRTVRAQSDRTDRPQPQLAPQAAPRRRRKAPRRRRQRPARLGDARGASRRRASARLRARGCYRGTDSLRRRAHRDAVSGVSRGRSPQRGTRRA